jgi:predicted nucleic acid-binding protein
VTLIVDAGPLVALGDRRDRCHRAVRALLTNEPGELVVPAPVSAEVDYLVRRRGGHEAARRFLEDVAAGRFRVEGLTPEEHGVAAELDRRYKGLDPGLADLSIVLLAHRLRTRRVATFDERHFRVLRPLGGGIFTLLPAEG